MGSIIWNGYGQIKIRNKNYYAHRVSWEYHRGEIPEGMEIHHKCAVEACVNPDHLMLVTHKEHMKLHE